MITGLRRQRASESAVRGASTFLVLASVSIASMVTPLNSTMLTVALPDIRSEFGVSHAEVAWLISAYLIAMAVAQPICERLSDQIGHVRTLRLAMSAFAGCSIASAVAPSFLVLVVFRTLQAMSGAALIPAGLAMLRHSIDQSKLGRATGIPIRFLACPQHLVP